MFRTHSDALSVYGCGDIMPTYPQTASVEGIFLAHIEEWVGKEIKNNQRLYVIDP